MILKVTWWSKVIVKMPLLASSSQSAFPWNQMQSSATLIMVEVYSLGWMSVSSLTTMEEEVRRVQEVSSPSNSVLSNTSRSFPTKKQNNDDSCI